MAISEQEEFEFRRRAEAEQAALKSQGPKTLLDTVARGIGNLPGDAANTVVGLGRTLADVTTDPSLIVKAAGSALKSGVDIAKGGLQHVREMSPAEYQGSATPMNKTAYDKFAEDNYNKYGTKENTYKTVSDHPLGAALTAASVVVPALRATRLDSLVAKGVDGAVSRVAPAVTKVTGAERRALAASATMRGAAATDFATGKRLSDAEAAQAQAQADAAAARAQRAAAYAEEAKRRRGALTGRQAEAAKGAVLPEPEIGTPAHLSEIGDSVRDPAYAAQGDIEGKMQAAYAEHKAAMDAIVEDRRKAGVGVSDGVTAKALVKQSEALVKPDPITRPDVGPRLAKSAGGNLHEDLLNVLKENRTPLNEADAVLAKKAGATVYKAPDGSLYRVDKPDFATVDNFRRFVGEVAHGEVEGYKAIGKDEAMRMYQGLTQVLDEYTAGASKPLREAWKTGKQQLEPFERVRAGQAVVGMQNGVSVPSVPAASLPGRIVAGGRDTVNQAAAVAGSAPVANAMRSQVQNALTGVKGSEAIGRVVGKGTKYGDIIHGDPDLESAVSEFVAKTKAAEAKGALADTLGQRATTAGKRSDQLNKVAEALQGTSAKSTDAAAKAASVSSGYARDLANLEIADPKSVGKMYTDMLERAHKEGRISLQQYQQGQMLAQSAQKDFALKASRDKWLKGAATTLGIASVGGGAVSVVRGAANLAK
jgi:hypothetical protein